MKKIKALIPILGLSLLTSCSLEDRFIFGGNKNSVSQNQPASKDPNDSSSTSDAPSSDADLETFDDCKNSIFFALYNYYGFDGQHFTNKWLGRNDALAAHGYKVTGYEGQKDARKFKIERQANSDLPEDAKIVRVNNQNWDTTIQYAKPFAKYHPRAVISTCNGVEMASSNIKSVQFKVSNATMGGFSPTYRSAFVDGSLRYLVAKYTAHILPIVAASVNALDNGKARKNADGTALRLSISQWAIQTLEEYDRRNAVDSVLEDHPTVRKINVDKYFDKTNPDYGPEKLSEFVSSSTKENIEALYAENESNGDADKAAFRAGKKYKCGIIAPSSVNDQVQLYIDFIQGYLAKAYNFEVLPVGSVTSSNTQKSVATQLCNQGANFIISVQDDTERNAAAQVCNEKGVYFAIAGSCQNALDYAVIKNLPYYVGSIGTSPEEERRSAKERTEYYLQCRIKRAQSQDALYEYEKEVKGLNKTKEESLSFYVPFDKERDI